ncbi:MAG: trypsin-like peptidase domain-containing protein [Pyrinomonadaceae bacterium]
MKTHEQVFIENQSAKWVSAFAAIISIFSFAGYSQAPSQERTLPTVSVAAKLSDSFAEIARLVEPSVVSIDAKTKIPDTASGNRNAPGDSDDVLEFFRRQLPRRPIYSVGSGFIIDKSGYILTNGHVIDNTTKITVKLSTGEEYQAQLVGTDDETDLAVLKITTGRDLTALKLADSDKARVGDWVLAVGSPFGLSRSVTAGIISQIRRETPDSTSFQQFIQTDAAINRGNSGGPLVNLDGEAIGVNSQIATTSGDSNGVGFAFPSTEAASVAKQLIEYGKVKRGFLGVGLDSVKAEYAKIYGLGDIRGAIVTQVTDPLSGAAKAGIRSGDVIVEFDGKPVISAQDLIAKVGSAVPDNTVGIAFLRESGNSVERKTTTLKLGERPPRRIGLNESPAKPAPVKPRDSAKPFGLTLVELTPQAAADYQVEGQSGLFVKEINPESLLNEVKNSTGNGALGEGDIIQRINRVTVKDAKSFSDAVNKLKPGDPVVLHVVAVDPRSKTGRLKIVQFTVQ